MKNSLLRSYYAVSIQFVALTTLAVVRQSLVLGSVILLMFFIFVFSQKATIAYAGLLKQAALWLINAVLFITLAFIFFTLIFPLKFMAGGHSKDYWIRSTITDFSKMW